MADPTLLSDPPRPKSRNDADAGFELVDSRGRKIPRKVHGLASKKMGGHAPFVLSRYNFNPEKDPPNVHVNARDYPRPRETRSRGSSESSRPRRGSVPDQEAALDVGTEGWPEGLLGSPDALKGKSMIKKKKGVLT